MVVVVMTVVNVVMVVEELSCSSKGLSVFVVVGGVVFAF
jgi:hypothetical protein